MTVSCNKEGCDKTWGRDPCLEVECPTCGADVGQRCERPSGWKGPFVDFHKARDLKALEDGHYGDCLMGKCPESLTDLEDGVEVDPVAEPEPEPEQATLAIGDGRW